MPESTSPLEPPGPPNARSLNDLLRIREDNLDKIHHRYGAIGTAVGYKVGDIAENPQPGKQAPAILIFVPKKLEPTSLLQDQLAGKEVLLWDNSRKLVCRTDVIPAEFEPGTPIPPGLTAENAARVRRLNSGQLGVTGGVSIENLDMPEFSTRQLTASCAVVRNRSGGPSELGLLTNAHAAVRTNTEIGLVRNPGASSRLGILDSNAQDDPNFGKRIRELLHTLDDVDTHLDAAFVKLYSEWTSKVSPGVDGLPPLGEPYELNLDTMGPIGMDVVSVGQQSGLQTGRIFAYGFSWRASTGRFHWTDYLIYSKTERFSLPGDSGKLIVTADSANRPLALHWGGSFSLLRPGGHREWWGYSTDIGRVLRGLNASIYRGGTLPSVPQPTGKDSGKPDGKPVTPGS